MSENPVRPIGSRLELFVDDWLLAEMRGVSHRLHHPVPQEAILHIDQPWEMIDRELPEAERQAQIQAGRWNGPCPFGFSSVLKDGNLYRLYYTWDRDREASLTGIAESRDGIHWEKPKLGIVEFRGSRSNNLILAQGRWFDITPFIDENPESKPEERYKTISGAPPSLLGSPDGLHWRKLRDEPVLTDGAFDSQNLVFWDSEKKCYMAFYRDFVRQAGDKKIRAIKVSQSPNLTGWPRGEFLDYGSAPLEHFYTNGVTPYFRAPHIYLGFPMRFVPERKAVPEHPYEGVSDAVFMSSRDGRRWDRRFLEGWIRPGLDIENWTERNFLVTRGMLPTGPAELSMYWVEHFRHPTNRIRRGSLRMDGFVSLHAAYAGGEVLTHPLTFEGSRLTLNYSTSAVGSVRVEVLHPSGEPIPGLSGADAPERYGDAISGVYGWASGPDLMAWSGKPVRLRIRLKDADLYSLRFQV